MPRNFFLFFLSSLFLLNIAGCAHYKESVGMSPPKVHAWSYLQSYGDEPGGYATYSYVLAGRDESDISHTQRYKALIAAIQGSTPITIDIPQSVPKSLMNLFLIPAARDTSVWNIQLSLSLVAVLAASDARFSNPGPFLVTFYHPINFSADPEITMLFVDLTRVHPDAMSEIATAYKRRISEAPIHGIERLKSLKLALLNTLLVTEDRIAFATTAYANLKAAFPPE